MLKKTISAVLALLMCLSAAGCSDTGESSSQSPESDSGISDSSASESIAAPDTSAAAFAPSKTVGEKLKAVYDIIDKGHYTLECELTGTNIPGTIDVLRVVDGSDSYQLQKEKLGSHGTVTLSGKNYDFDFVCGMYRENPSPQSLNVIEQIVKSGVPRTNSHTSDKASEYDNEQYTYTGDTYITVMDFFFDKKDGHLVRYDMTYSVEGSDDIVETRTVKRFDTEVDSSVFNAYFADTLVNFDSMSEQQKLGFCQGLCASWGISADEMYELGVSSDSLGSVDYDTLFTLIHTYGKRHDVPDAESSMSEGDSSTPDDVSTAESSESADGAASVQESSPEDAGSLNSSEIPEEQ